MSLYSLLVLQDQRSHNYFRHDARANISKANRINAGKTQRALRREREFSLNEYLPLLTMKAQVTTDGVLIVSVSKKPHTHTEYHYT